MSKIKKIPQYIKFKILTFLSSVQKKRRDKYVKRQRVLLKNDNLTLISNNCNGCVLLHELGVRYNSQFVNLFLYAEDYIAYLENFDYYNEQEILFDHNWTEYPIGKLGNLTVHFVHYKTEEEAIDKWNERKRRIDKENMFIIFTQQKGCDDSIVRRFDRLPFENKVIFTYRNYSDVLSAVCIDKYKNNPLGVHMFLDFESPFSIRRNYDVFDFISWFNGEKDIQKLLKK